MSPVIVLATACALALGTTLVSAACVLVHVRRRPKAPPREASLPPLSVLKPMKGADPELYDNLAALARQEYPEFEIVCGVEVVHPPRRSPGRLPPARSIRGGLATSPPTHEAGGFGILTDMPRHPEVAQSVSAVAGSVYSGLAHRLAAYEGEVYPLHVGDTWLEPPAGCRMEDLTVAEHPGMHRYAKPHGMPALLDALAERLRPRFGIPVAPDEILIAAGATGGLGAVVGALVDPGDEVLIAAPHWPLIAGIVRSFHGRPVPVPLVGEPEIRSPEDAVGAMEKHAGERTVALYVSTPNNPTGRVIPRPWLEALAVWARAKDLWILTDEVYEDYVYEGEHAYTRPLAPERTFSIHSFSKALGMAGNRVGYVVGPAEVMRQVLKVSTHTFYSAPTAGQLAALEALEGPGEAWIAQAREKYAKLGRDAAERLGVEPPAGSTFLFLDVADRLDDRGLGGFLEDCVERGLLVAPGPSFGPYPTHVRLCFTSAEPEVVRRGVGVLAGLLGR